MRFESEYRAYEIADVLIKKTHESFVDDNNILSCCEGNKFILRMRRGVGGIRTKLSCAFYGKIEDKNGKTVLKGSFRPCNIDIISWLIMLLLLVTTAFIAAQGDIAKKTLNAVIMCIAWCAVSAAAFLAESIAAIRQRRAVISFIENNLLIRENKSQVD